jgi:ketosteroid isomerase-like protein
MADDFCWTVTGSTQWSKTYAGKQAVIDGVLAPLRLRLTPPIIVVGHRFIADGDYVAVEARGQNTTKAGVPYNNTYCFVFRVANGKLREVTEYMDTALVTAVLSDSELPSRRPSSPAGG